MSILFKQAGFTTKTEIPLVVTFCRCESWKTWLFILVMTCVYLVPFIGGIPKYFRDCLFNIFCTYIYSYKILFCPSWNFSYFRAWECPNSIKDSKQWFQVRGRENNPAGLNTGVNSHRGWRQNCDPGRKNTPLPQSTTKVRSSQVLSAGLWLTLLDNILWSSFFWSLKLIGVGNGGGVSEFSALFLELRT